VDIIDASGYRPNVGIVICDAEGRVFWAKRVGHNAWQFPQGGIHHGESPRDTLFRELHEEVGLEPAHVEILAQTQGWLKYQLPRRYIRRAEGNPCVGQKQKWFLLRLVGEEHHIRFDRGPKAEFDAWRWVSYWYPVGQVIDFKRDVYRLALKELARALPGAESRSARRGG
jgi:putative (di)nucleoside polyphosphate hydrolase